MGRRRLALALPGAAARRRRLNGDIWGTDTDNVWAVGWYGTILQWNGSAWTAQSSGTTNLLSGVWASDANNVWVAGESGTILRVGWRRLDSPEQRRARRSQWHLG